LNRARTQVWFTGGKKGTLRIEAELKYWIDGVGAYNNRSAI